MASDEAGKGPQHGGGKLPGRAREQGVYETRARAWALAFIETGFSAREACKKIGVNAKHSMAAWRFLKSPVVQEILREFMREKSLAAGVSAEKVIALVANMAEASMKDYCSWETQTLQIVPSAELTRDQARCIKKISIKPTKYGNHITVELYNARLALEMLMRFLGLVRGEGSELNPDEIAAAIRQAVAAPLAMAEEGKESGSGQQ